MVIVWPPVPVPLPWVQLVVSGATLSSNHAVTGGGAIHATTTAVRLSKCKLAGNYAPGLGGAVQIVAAPRTNLSAFRLDACEGTGNRALHGGALAVVATETAGNPQEVGELQIVLNQSSLTGNFVSACHCRHRLSAQLHHLAASSV